MNRLIKFAVIWLSGLSVFGASLLDWAAFRAAGTWFIRITGSTNA